MCSSGGGGGPAQKIFFFGNFFQHVKKLINFGNFVNIKVAKFKLYLFGFLLQTKSFLIGQSEKSEIETPCIWFHLMRFCHL